jgi:uncharacterized protein (DUF2147 family)
MKKLFVLAALLMATPSAHAGNSISFQIEGHKIRVHAPRNCNSLSCIQISAPSLSDSSISGSSLGNFKGFKSKGSSDDAGIAEPAPTTAPAPAPTASQPAAPVTSPAPAVEASPAPIAAPITAPPSAPVAAAPAPTTPLGIWATEENKGEVRIEECGQNLCGYAVTTGKKILINMKPQASKWTGTIYDPDSGRNYDSTIAMKGTNALRVQGCAFGGMLCGGQTWKRVS